MTVVIAPLKNDAMDPVQWVQYKGGLSNCRLKRVLEYIDTCNEHNLTADEVAQVAGLGRYHFGKMFKQSTGFRLHQYVLSRRLQRAEELLRDPRHPLADVAAATGFSNQSHFTTVFARTVGMPPGAYRTLHVSRSA
ncbi:MAG: helix-turn-helix transcriptional regulator [Bryobacteraceae bacterium]